MAGPLLERQLNTPRPGKAQFDLANADDDAGIRRLLRDNSMPGTISLSLEREPDYFADTGLPGEEKRTIVARESGRIVCAGSCAVRSRFINGEKRRVGYLAGLRLDSSVAGRFDILRGGYQFFRDLHRESPADFYFTSIATENKRARDFLERRLPGMPAYEWIADFITLVLPVPRRKADAAGQDRSPFLGEICEFLNRQGSKRQLSPCWSVEELAALAPLGVTEESFHILRDKAGIAACASLWDQRGFKQTVVRGYSSWLARARPFLNLAAPWAGIPRLPAKGSALANAFIAHLAADRPHTFHKCIDALLASAAGAKIELVTLGFASNDPRLAEINARFRSRKYHSRIYGVRWPGLDPEPVLDGRVLSPEVALL